MKTCIALKIYKCVLISDILVTKTKIFNFSETETKLRMI